jgi:hypothetical protein
MSAETQGWKPIADADRDGLYWIADANKRLRLAFLESGRWRYLDGSSFEAAPLRCKLVTSPKEGPPSMNAKAEMPRYRSHKEVWALKISAIEMLEDRSAKIAPADHRYATLQTKPDFPFNGSEDDLGYFVVYADGYQSWSPTKAFEEGYTQCA